VDGQAVDFSQTVMYRGMMFTGVPNLAWAVPYLRLVSATLRYEVTADFVCRLLNHMAARGARKVSVALRPEDADMKLSRFIDEKIFNPGYVERAIHLWPKRGDKPEWEHSQDYFRDLAELPQVNYDDAPFIYDGGR
jgi:cation diffusion facilitator CzcD-associated flavoprotein CzcO